MTGVVSFPTPLYANPPIEPQYFRPWRFEISGITLGVTTVVTMIIPTITELNYVVGQLVRLIIPPTFGCRQLNEITAYVLTVTPPNQVTLLLDSSHGNPYIASAATTRAQILPVGDINNGHTNRVPWCQKPWIPGSFRNISPGPREV